MVSVWLSTCGKTKPSHAAASACLQIFVCVFVRVCMCVCMCAISGSQARNITSSRWSQGRWTLLGSHMILIASCTMPGTPSHGKLWFEFYGLNFKDPDILSLIFINIKVCSEIEWNHNTESFPSFLGDVVTFDLFSLVPFCIFLWKHHVSCKLSLLIYA